MESLKEKVINISKLFRDEEENLVALYTKEFISDLAKYFKEDFEEDLLKKLKEDADALRQKKCTLILYACSQIIDYKGNMNPYIEMKFLNWNKKINIKSADFVESHKPDLARNILNYIYGYLSDDFVCMRDITNCNVIISW